MKSKIGAYLMILAGVAMMFMGCEGNEDPNVPILLTKTGNPVLVNFSTTVAANFSNFTSLVKFGTPITFTVAPDAASFSHVTQNAASFSHFSTVTTRVVKTDVGGMAWVSLRSSLPGRFIVTAHSGPFNGVPAFAGSTAVSFINQPALVQVRVGLRQPLTSVGDMTFDLVSTGPASAFVNFSGLQSPAIFAQDTEPILPAGGTVTTTNLLITSYLGVNMPARKQLFRFDYVPIPPSVPTFTLANASAIMADINATVLDPTFFIISTRYYDAAGNEMFY